MTSETPATPAGFSKRGPGAPRPTFGGRGSRWLLLAAGCIAAAGCERRHGQTPRGEPPPVVHVAPVEMRPFEDGYALGYGAGMADATPRAKPPPRGEVEAKATQAAGGDPARNERWWSGWVEGYLEGFQLKATGKK